MNCLASVVLEAGLPDTSSTFADEGTAAHFLAEQCLSNDYNAGDYHGMTIVVDKATGDTRFQGAGHTTPKGASTFKVDEEMAGNVQVYVDRVRAYAVDHELLVEQRVEFSSIVGVDDSFGTSDAIILTSDGEELQVHDLKYGKGVRVSAERNEQLMLYALGALSEFGMIGDFKRARMVIHQPRLDHVSEWDCTIEDLEQFGNRAKLRALAITLIDVPCEDDFAPGEKTCQWCKAKATCPALASHVLSTVSDDFVDVDQPIAPQLSHAEVRIAESPNDRIANYLSSVDLIESWCKAVRSKAESELHAGREVPGYKLVEGRRGARQWTDKSEVESALKAMRLKTEEMYDLSLISPTTAEKLHKAGTIGPRQWPKLQPLITQSTGKPSVAPASDKRPALVIGNVEEDFDDATVDDLV